jgi:hypothetical protein
MRSLRPSAARRRARTPLGLLAAVVLGLGVTACGGADGKTGSVASTPGASSSSASSTSGPAGTPSGSGSSGSLASHSPPHEDQDRDYDSAHPSSYFDSDDLKPQDFPIQASPADIRAVTALIKRYFAAAAAGDGVTGCSLIYSLFEETIVETYGQPPAGPPALRGRTCAVVLSKLFKSSHGQLAAEVRTLEVAGLRLDGNRGLALLRYHNIHGRRIEVHRERGAWKIDAVIDTEIS